MEQIPRNSSLEGIINRSSLMDVPFRSMQRQHEIIYLGSIDDPSAAADDELSAANMRVFAGVDMEQAGYRTSGGNNVRRGQAREGRCKAAGVCRLLVVILGGGAGALVVMAGGSLGGGFSTSLNHFGLRSPPQREVPLPFSVTGNKRPQFICACGVV